ncbi:MAG: short-chain dehydrogenase [Sphingobacteriales bacterium 17-39-43]|uniref:SDR family oxidoreductase n=1 Tax=Daejeonella sp. TaxID=2805397 RepID=UPI000BC648CD|nr:SDR family oxidoreductase [Daejeonella sp.]OYZ32416.1 MAG: short-chain dehydrogenase [Sphingobacteriales bacterium 16-39-50]OYZ56139.1 MAG: short-chain dehydrogenase [Sphingobacteriales bacterium 24-40-4]OZA25779.1 MAG: short-chain dehydrogenase [Sphingobacteriales bacterium 17-39-43]OZA57860.1 MAG: short-chain dehydrogenase [Sphingobacteriales bacterium 39-40-5]HQS04399.1 SDR family oxidoreductase [Daejeonella sp.]
MYNEPMLRDNALSGKTIIVTGGGTGLGRAMSTYFLKLGANVVITSRKMDVLEKTAAEMQEEASADGIELRAKVIPLQCDVRKPEEVDEVLKKTLDTFGQVNGLLNNAAGNFISPTERLSPNAFSTIIDIVLKGTANCTMALGKHWIKEKQAGTILNIVTTYAFTGSGYVVPSACAKGGVLAMTRSLAAEWGKYGIRNNAIAPGPFPTKGAWDRLLPGDMAKKFDFKNRVPLKRVGDHQELANLAAFMMSDFSGYINGEVITIDGGEWLQGAGQFNGLEAITPEMWDMLEMMTRSAKGS